MSAIMTLKSQTTTPNKPSAMLSNPSLSQEPTSTELLHHNQIHTTAAGPDGSMHDDDDDDDHELTQYTDLGRIK